MEADAAFFACAALPWADVVDFLAVDEAGFLLEDAAAVDFVAVDAFAVGWELLVELVFLAESAVAGTANTAQAPNQALNNAAIQIRFIDSI